MRDSQQGQGIHVFSINGPLKVTKRFAYDNRYVLCLYVDWQPALPNSIPLPG